MQTLKIKIHSFVDVITNSSSEIFVSADTGTVNAIKEIINGVLKSGGSTKTTDDLYLVKLVGNDVSVTALKGGDKIAAKHLSELTNLFNIDAQYNG